MHPSTLIIPPCQTNLWRKSSYTEDVDTSLPLDKKGNKHVQVVISTFLYYAHCVKSTMLPAPVSLAMHNTNPMKTPPKIVHQFLDYAATHPVVLAGHSDHASYLSETNARSRAGGHLFMSNDDTIPSNNGVILAILQIIKVVMSSAAEAEIRALYQLQRSHPGSTPT